MDWTWDHSISGIGQEQEEGPSEPYVSLRISTHVRNKSARAATIFVSDADTIESEGQVVHQAARRTGFRRHLSQLRMIVG